MNEMQVKCFLEVAKRLNFTSAAKSLFISQSNISRQIATFEEELGLTLFVRNKKEVKLTAQGHLLAESLSEMIEEWNSVLQRAKNSVKKYSGSLTVGCTGHAKSNSYLSQLLSNFRETRPEIQIVKERNTQKKLIEGLDSDYYDAILLAGHDVDFLSNVNTLTLFYSRIGIAIHRTHPLFWKKDVTLSDFRESNFLRYKPTEIPLEKDFLFQLCKNYGYEPNIIAEYSDFEEFLFAIEMGEGVSLVYEETEVISNMNLRFIPINEDWPQKYLPMQLTRMHRNKNPILDEFYVFAKRYSALHEKKDF